MKKFEPRSSLVEPILLAYDISLAGVVTLFPADLSYIHAARAKRLFDLYF